MRKKKKTIPARNDTSVKKKRVYKKKAAVKARKGAAPKTRNNFTLTESGFWQMIRSTLRRKSMISWKPISIVRNKQRVPYTGPNKRQRYSYICTQCKGEFSGKNVAVHHILECGSLTCAEDLPGFVERLFCEESGLILLCSGCHDKLHKK